MIISARVEKHADNREVCAVIADYTESCRPHVGLAAPLQVVFEPFRDIPEGNYVALVYVSRYVDGRWEHPFDKVPFRILSGLGG